MEWPFLSGYNLVFEILLAHLLTTIKQGRLILDAVRIEVEQLLQPGVPYAVEAFIYLLLGTEYAELCPAESVLSLMRPGTLGSYSKSLLLHARLSVRLLHGPHPRMPLHRPNHSAVDKTPQISRT